MCSMWRHQWVSQCEYPDKLLTAWLNWKIEENAQNMAGSVLPTPGCSTIKALVELITGGWNCGLFYLLFLVSVFFCLQWTPADFVSKNQYNFLNLIIHIIMSHIENFFQENTYRYMTRSQILGSGPELKVDAQPLSHPGIAWLMFFKNIFSDGHLIISLKTNLKSGNNSIFFPS